MICALCNKANVRTYDLRIVIPGSAEKLKNTPKIVTRSPEAKPPVEQHFYMCLYGLQNADFFKFISRIDF